MVLALIVEGLAFAALDLGIDAIKSIDKGKPDQTIVELVIGSGSEEARMGGATPAIALWNDRGERVGQHGSLGKEGDGANPVYHISHNQGHSGSAQAEYMMMSNIDDDAICISAVYVTDDRVSTAFFGDLPKMCGMSWGHSNRAIGDAQQIPDCFWLDNDGTNGINAQALSVHLRDMVANTDRIAQYNERIDSLCGSTPRFSFWGDLLPDSLIPMFDPPLDYEKDSGNGGIGRDKDIDRVLDKQTFDKSVSMYRGPQFVKRQPLTNTSAIPGVAGVSIPDFMLKRRGTSSGPSARRKRSQRMSERLIVTPHAKHSAVELCNSETSWGPDEVSLTERMFCDMETKSLYPLCKNGIEENCFDLEKKFLILPGGKTEQDDVVIHSRDLPLVKRYNTTEYW
ncbi:hypothetical protein jhhlp_005025 [Lomentospora prolificans]|uniref:Uncharacterized protein n=1 Tax=Lomentospora prolificans TaxID=41688 RepID=A0A2N3N884_9PEZI|nr:hypothetical protein jhhlp_005025 [Lomentospora prolificans]